MFKRGFLGDLLLSLTKLKGFLVIIAIAALSVIAINQLIKNSKNNQE